MPRGQYERAPRQEAAEPEQNAAVLQEPVSPRQEEMRRERRRRDDGDLDRMASMKLAVPRDIQEQAKREGKVLRWIMDNRMAEAHQNDWDAVTGVEPIQANPREGTDERLVLCSKFADWHQDDQQRDNRLLDEREEALMSGNVEDAGRSSAGLHVPKGQRNRITTQRGL